MRTRRGISTAAIIGVIVVVVIIAAAAVVLVPSMNSSTSSSSSSSTSASKSSSASSQLTTTTTPSSSSSTTSTTSSTSTTTTNTDAALYQAALKEGSVVIYGSPTAAQFGNITAAFNAVYPGITVQYTSLQPPQAVPQVESELKAQGHSADVLLQAATTMYTLEPTGSVCSCVAPYVSPYASGFPKAVLDPLNQSTPIIELAFGWAYNTNMINAANVPTTMAQVANSQFKGEVVMNDPTTGTAFTQYWASLEGVLGNATITTFLQNLKNATAPTIVPTTTSCMNDVAQGLYAICLGGYMQDAAPDMQAGSPMKFLNITSLPLMLTPSNAAILKNAQHPNSAQLLIDFMASPAGQTAWGNINVRTPVSQTVTAKWSLTSEIKTFDPGAGTQIYFPTVAVATAGTAWGATFAFLKS
jgi:iron(III) transport system substrate-binding protein